MGVFKPITIEEIFIISEQKNKLKKENVSSTTDSNSRPLD